ncbi:MAG: hypothetical protein E3J36_02685 [Candidatus Nealsonbacteria bacterium]|nr:MAG: hypothetical protein E3J36_02685 [Candidatus Nealsonbacteria bacterium]
MRFWYQLLLIVGMVLVLLGLMEFGVQNYRMAMITLSLGGASCVAAAVVAGASIVSTILQNKW